MADGGKYDNTVWRVDFIAGRAGEPSLGIFIVVCMFYSESNAASRQSKS